MDRHARTITVIRRHLGEVDDDDAAAFAEWILTSYRVAPALLGAYVRRMAVAGDLAPAYAEHHAGRRPDPATRPSLIAYQQAAPPLRGPALHTAAAAVKAAIRPTRTTDAGVDLPARRATA